MFALFVLIAICISGSSENYNHKYSMHCHLCRGRRKVSSSKSLNFSILPKNPHHYDYIVNFDFFTEIFLKVRLFLQKIYILSRLKKLRMQHFFFVFFLNLQQHCASASIKRKNRCSKNHKTSISSFKNLKKGIKKTGHFLSDQS